MGGKNIQHFKIIISYVLPILRHQTRSRFLLVCASAGCGNRQRSPWQELPGWYERRYYGGSGTGRGVHTGALAFIKQGEKFPPRSLIVGNPGKNNQADERRDDGWKTERTKLYQQLPQQCFGTLKSCEPLKEEIEQKAIIRN